MRAIWERLKESAKAAGMAVFQAVRTPITPMLVLRALLGVLLFLFGIVAGVWLIIRYRRRLAG